MTVAGVVGSRTTIFSYDGDAAYECSIEAKPDHEDRLSSTGGQLHLHAECGLHGWMERHRERAEFRQLGCNTDVEHRAEPLLDISMGIIDIGGVLCGEL